MKNALTLKPNFILVTTLVAVILSSCIATYFGSNLVPQTVKLITVTILLTFYFCQLNKMANVFLTTFILFFIADACSVFSIGDIMIKGSRGLYIVAYILLIFILLGKLKRIRFQGLVSFYLLFVVLLNSYFLYVLYEAAKDNFVDQTNMVLYIMHGITLIVLMYFAFAVYLSKETGQSITYLLMVFCIVFSDVLNFINNLYIYYWLFEMFERTLHILSLYLLYKYVFDHHTLTYQDKKMNLSDYFINTTQQLKDIHVESTLES